MKINQGFSMIIIRLFNKSAKPKAEKCISFAKLQLSITKSLIYKEEWRE
jgi:hypothetical protein